MDSTWGFIIPIVAIVGGISFAIVNTVMRSRTVTREANVLQDVRSLLRERGEAEREQARLLRDIEQRLAQIETTLNQVG
ncbi:MULTISPECIES: hypothetical protein [Arthrobacter]|uniref:Uncharacterized protein n=1 Tax=Arthrobacter terricola TaxID=2547396 RepID=A0A4R5KCI0_9MICC|nr:MULTISPECIES: hypothetical protein [Arthrobacter]MBT8163024.1 hypothetical protein [Arthrobacter sp. GN70]TDF91770.1 hypothetical protein E1809_19830 [Arthrobacter terricola]